MASSNLLLSLGRMMESDPLVDAALSGLGDRLERNGVNMSLFRPPASVDEIEAAFDPYPHFRMTPSIMSFYRWHNGHDADYQFPITGQIQYPSLAESLKELALEPAFWESLLDYWAFDFSDPPAPTNAMPLWRLFTGEGAPMVVVLADCYDEGAVYDVNFGATVDIAEEMRADSLLEVVNHWNACIDDGRYEFKTHTESYRWCSPTKEWVVEARLQRRAVGDGQLWAP